MKRLANSQSRERGPMVDQSARGTNSQLFRKTKRLANG